MNKFLEEFEKFFEENMKDRMRFKNIPKHPDKWPVEDIINKSYEPNFIFLLSPSNSGTTAIGELFKTSDNVSSLNDISEGHKLIYGLRRTPGKRRRTPENMHRQRWNKTPENMHRQRWNPNLIEESGVDLCSRSIRSVWVNECYRKHKSEGAEYFIEKSPPNMVRIEFLQSLFPNHILLANNRDPYAYASSMFHRYTKNKKQLTVNERNIIMRDKAKKWVRISTILKGVIEKQNVPYLSYEKFCEQPTLYQKIIDNSIFAGKIKLDFEHALKVKNYKPTSLITNYNEKQISKLTKIDIEVITNYLKDHKELLFYFGYTLKK